MASRGADVPLVLRPRFSLTAVLPALLLATLAVSTPSDARQTQPPEMRPVATTFVLAPYEARIVTLVNAARMKAGRRPLRVSSCASRYAEAWSARMASTRVFAHRTNLGAVMRTCGATAIGENIAYGNVSADRMVQMWLGSPGHRANILSSTYTHIGVGAVRTSSGRWYGTQNFLRIPR